MGIDLHLSRTALAEMVRRRVHAHLFSTCLPLLDGTEVIVDHIDVADEAPTITQRDTAVDISATLRVHWVTRAAALAAVAGQAPTGQRVATLVFALMIQPPGTLILRCADADLTTVGEVLGVPGAVLRRGLLEALGAVIETDLTESVAAFAPAASSARAAVSPDDVVLQLGTGDAPKGRRAYGQDWGVFVGKDALIDRFVSLSGLDAFSDIPFARVLTAWDHADGAARMRFELRGRISLDPISALAASWGLPSLMTATARLPLEAEISVAAPGRLRIRAHWQLHVDLGALVPAAVDRDVRLAFARAINDELRRRDDIDVIGEREFSWQTFLPNISLGGASCSFTSVAANEHGAMIGGPVYQSSPPDKRLTPSETSPFIDNPAGISIEWCDGEPDEAALASLLPPDPEREARTRAYAPVVGALCGTEIVSGPADVTRYIHPGDQRIMVAIPARRARQITERITVLARTSRGVRHFDFGVPAFSGEIEVTLVCFDWTWDYAITAAAGAGVHFGLDGLINPIDNPLTHGDPWSQTIRVPGEELVPSTPDLGRQVEPYVDPRESWGVGRYLDERRPIAFEIALVKGLAPGDAVRVTLGRNDVAVIADDSGTARIPLLLESRMNPVAKIVRSGRSTGEVTVEHGMHESYVWDGTTARDERSLLAGDGAEGSGYVNEEFSGVPLVRVPGYEGEPLGIALDPLRGKFIVDLSDAEHPRAVGRYRGPLGDFAVFDDALVARDSNRAARLHRVVR